MTQKLSIAFFALFLICAGAVMAAGSASINSGSVDFTADGDGVVTVAGPDGFHQRLELEGGHASMGLYDDAGSPLADGTYKWQITMDGKAPADRSERAIEGESFSGAFTIAGGSPVNPLALESRKDQVILDDLIVDGSACVGLDCVNGESFGFDTLRLKENNLRVHFNDTSTTASFPGNDWRLVANDSSNGGSNHFSIEDSDAGRNPFRVEAGAPANALVVEADGDIGVGTLNPVVDMHIVSGNTPTLRLEQDGSNGFTPQTWDVAGNEANFFIRDATNGSTLPLQIKPGAPTATIFMAASGNVGIGTASPDDELDIQGAGPTLRFTNTGSAANNWRAGVNSGAGRLVFQADSGNVALQIDPQSNDNLVWIGRTDAETVTIEGTLALSTTCIELGGNACSVLGGNISCVVGSCP